MLKTKMFKFFYNALHKAVSLAGKSPIHVKEKITVHQKHTSRSIATILIF